MQLIKHRNSRIIKRKINLVNNKPLRKLILNQSTILKVENKLGYRFKDPFKLEIALTHKSYTPDVSLNNEKFELLGDKILNTCITLHLLHNFKNSNEGEIVKLLSLIVSSNGLSKIAEYLELSKCIVTDKRKLSNLEGKNDLLSCFVESLFGAVFLDSKSFSKTKDVIINVFQKCKSQIINDVDFYDYKSFLQGKTHSLWKTTPQYVLKGMINDQNNNKLFEIEMFINGKYVSNGTGSSKRKAEQNAAKNACKLLSFNIEDFYSGF